MLMQTGVLTQDISSPKWVLFDCYDVLQHINQNTLISHVIAASRMVSTFKAINTLPLHEHLFADKPVVDSTLMATWSCM